MKKTVKYSSEVKTRTFSQYKRLDITLWLVMLLVSEAIVCFAGSRWFSGQPYSLSVEPVFAALVFMRWSWLGVAFAVIGGLEYVLMFGGSVYSLITYGVGNLFAVIGLIFLLTMGKEKVRKNTFLTVVYVCICTAGMQLGRGLLSVIMGMGAENALSFVLTDILSCVFAVVVVCISRKLDGIFEDQKSYLLRINETEQGEVKND